MIFDMITGEVYENNIDYAPATDAFNKFVEQVLNGAEETEFDNIIVELITDNSYWIGDERENTFWWRAREHDYSNQHPFVKDEIGINYHTSSSGRFNKAGKGCLYLSKTRDNSFEEIQVYPNSLVSVGRFKVKEAIKVYNFESGTVSDSNGIYGGFDAFHARYFMVLFLANYINAKSSNKTYIVTQYVADLFQLNGVQGILYESVKDQQTECLCLFNDDHVQYCYTRQWKVIDYDGMNHQYTCKLVKETK